MTQPQELPFIGRAVFADDATTAFHAACQELNDSGIETKPRGQSVIELIDYNVYLSNPRNRIVYTPARKISYKYLAAEFIWYLSGSSHVSTIQDYAPFWSQIAEADGTVNSNYGYRLYGYSPDVPYNQWEMVKAALRSDNDTRQAIMHINASYDYTKNTKDRPCTLTLQWFIRENKLFLKVNMRSNDVVMGFGNDVFQFTMMQEMMLQELRQEGFPDLELGHYLHNAGSMHVYDRHFSMMDKVLTSDNNDVQKPSMKPMELKSTDRQNLVEVEKVWRVALKYSTAQTDRVFLQSIPEYAALSDYWKDFIGVCFFNDHVENLFT